MKMIKLIIQNIYFHYQLFYIPNKKYYIYVYKYINNFYSILCLIMSFTFLQRVANRANSIWGRGGGRAKGALVQKIYCKFREQINYVVIEI